jgi:hypothetical protein
VRVKNTLNILNPNLCGYSKLHIWDVWVEEEYPVVWNKGILKYHI